MNITYRFATPGDAEVLAPLNLQLIQDEGARNRMTVEQLAQRMRDWLSGAYRAAIFEAENEILGYALWRAESSGVYLRQFFVARAHRRRGVGRTCLDQLFLDVLSEHRVVLEVLTSNPGGLAFWKSAGFAEYAITLERGGE